MKKNIYCACYLINKYFLPFAGMYIICLQFVMNEMRYMEIRSYEVM